MSINPAHDVALEVATMIARAARRVAAGAGHQHGDVREAFHVFASFIDRVVEETRIQLDHPDRHPDDD